MENTAIPEHERRPFTFDRVVRLLIGVALGFAALWLLNVLSAVLLPFVIAWLIAYLLEPLVQRNRKVLHTKGRFWAVMISLTEMILLLVVLCVVFFPSIVDEAHQVAALIRRYADSDRTIEFVPQGVHDFLINRMDLTSLSDKFTRQDIRSIVEALGSMISGGVSFIMGLFDWFLVLLYVIFIMLDYEMLLDGIKHMVPPRFRKMVFAIFNDVTDSMNHYFRGQSMIAFIVGILFSIGFLIVGLPLAVVLGLFIGVLNLVPYLQLISIPITTILCLVCSVQDAVDFWPLWWECMAVYVVVQCIQDLVLTPKIMGKAMGLNPAIMLLSLSVWGTLLGFIGLIIALPLTTLLISYYNQYIKRLTKRHQINDGDDDIKTIDEIMESGM